MRGITRRNFIWTGLAFGVASTSASAESKRPLSLYEMDLDTAAPPRVLKRPEPGAGQLPPAESEVDYPIEAANVDLPAEFQPQIVSVPDIAPAGTIVVDPLQQVHRLQQGGFARGAMAGA